MVQIQQRFLKSVQWGGPLACKPAFSRLLGLQCIHPAEEAGLKAGSQAGLLVPPGMSACGIACRAAIVLAILALLAPPGEAKKFYDDDPLLQEPKPKTTTDPKSRQISDVYDFVYHSFGKRPPEGSSLGVNTLSEVP